jgi:hypothetical protein
MRHVILVQIMLKTPCSEDRRADDNFRKSRFHLAGAGRPCQGRKTSFSRSSQFFGLIRNFRKYLPDRAPRLGKTILD